MSKLRTPKNHPQQTAKRGEGPNKLFATADQTDEVDTRLTSDALWRRLDDEFHFTVDVAATASNTKCERFYDRESDGLAQDWSGEVVWCNPPYSQIAAWVAKAHSSPRATVVMLLPANRTEQSWWQDYIEAYRDKGLRVTTRFLRGRQGFVNGDGGGEIHAPFASVIVIFRAEITRLESLTSALHDENDQLIIKLGHYADALGETPKLLTAPRYDEALLVVSMCDDPQVPAPLSAPKEPA